MVDWHFEPVPKTGTLRNPINGEFFAEDAISEPGKALIREGIQNSLDAVSGEAPVIVRIYLSSASESVEAERIQRFIAGARQHLIVNDNGLHDSVVNLLETPCNYLLFEDFNTRGLQGDPEEIASRPDSKNHFSNFWRAEGVSDKGETDKGSWGVGKTVFWRASVINTIFAVTVRDDDKRHLLMGKSVLRSHFLDDVRHQDGYFGVNRDGDGFIFPTDDESVIHEFSAIFGLERGNDPGLSIVIPWYDEEISHNAIIKAVLHDYFYPILSNHLQVFIKTPDLDDEEVLDSSTLLDVTKKISSDIANELVPFIKLSKWSMGQNEFTYETSHLGNRWKWEDGLTFNEETLEDLRKKFQDGERIAIKVPLEVCKEDSEPENSHFDIFLERDLRDRKEKPIFIREGLIISDVSAPGTRGIRSLVIANGGPLAAFLRKAESPAHTDWLKSNIKGVYKIGCISNLAFIKNCVSELNILLTEDFIEQDTQLLAKFFPDEYEDSNKILDEESGEVGGDGPEPEPDPPVSKPLPFRIQKIEGGFTICSGKIQPEFPCLVMAEVAYDIRRSNPFKKYRVSDFDLSEHPIVLDPAPIGVEIIAIEENKIEMKIYEPDFRLNVTGFDIRRDLILDVNEVGEKYADTKD